MTEQGAINFLLNYNRQDRYDKPSENRRLAEATQLAVMALKKQIPMKPIGEHYAHMRCPACNHRIPSGMGSSSRRRDDWCNYCGQKIDWSKGEQ